MTVFVETDFLLAIAKEDDWLQERAEDVLDEREVVTSPFAYLEMLIVLDRNQFDYVRLFANLLEVIPVGSEDEKQVVLKAVTYFEDGMTPFDSFHAAIADTRGLALFSSDKAYEDADAERLSLEPRTDE
ncbi:PIN domain-containing protein [Halobacterium bonnevillei]|jgi:predicted nucleic acid-binding protein|uniref:PIN domain-containing protein n=1 Tax=Halobacterium bonnevillei TaxID=2692200 RepID=A0A6B0SBM7_9EURY|nr:PIN domain-containing protein [Halobacterium bonnevillei]MXR19114.1 PIN domain-containing protein [Halobacterium bonnevillei]